MDVTSRMPRGANAHEEISNCSAFYGRIVPSVVPIPKLEQTASDSEQFPAIIYRDDDHVRIVSSSRTGLCTDLTEIEAVVTACDPNNRRLQAVAYRQFRRREQ